MAERGSVPGSGQEEYGRPFGWRAAAVVLALAVWLAFGPLGPVWLYLLGWVVALAAADGVHRLVRRRGWDVPSPARMVAALLRLGPQSWLVAPRWARVRLLAGGFLVFAAIAGYMGRQAGGEYQLLANLREQGSRTDATVVEITDRSEEGRVLSVAVRFGTPSGPVRAEVDIGSDSADDARPGARIPVVYNPAHPAEVRSVAYLDGREADGVLQGSIVTGLLAAGFLVGTTRETLRARHTISPNPPTEGPRAD
ncbi:DUF3592 domain-containing protein [Streptacidiphilus griseoplanus]|uniref:DUF3592 domain-containing protein n=1 Tax=Peterkaempfera griseoplana TaxID=66896 RepID=UPI00099E1BC6|nr:DUF3592 domain-containing protein [Peterkaempfera griseoplana]